MRWPQAGSASVVRELIDLVGHYGLPFVFLNVLLEQGGLPIPAYPTLIVAAALAASAGHLPIEIVAVAAVAALCADLLWYRAGRRLGPRALLLLCRLSLSPDACVRRTRSLFARFGAPSLLFAKFVPVLGLFTTALSGSSRISLARFVLFDFVGAVLWAGVAVAIGVVFRDAIEDVLAWLSSLGAAGVAISAAFLGLYLGLKVWQRWRSRHAPGVARISVMELRSRIEAGRAPVIVDVRDGASRAERGAIPGAVAIDLQGLAGISDLVLRDCEVVVYCDCPGEASAMLAAKRLRHRGFTRVRVLHGGTDAWLASSAPPGVVAFAEATDYPRSC